METLQVGTLTDATELNLFTLKQQPQVFTESLKPPSFEEHSATFHWQAWRNFWAWFINHSNTGALPRVKNVLKFQCYKYNKLGYTLPGNQSPLKTVKLFRLAYLAERLDVPLPSHPGVPVISRPHVEDLMAIDCETGEFGPPHETLT